MDTKPIKFPEQKKQRIQFTDLEQIEEIKKFRVKHGKERNREKEQFEFTFTLSRNARKKEMK